MLTVKKGAVEIKSIDHKIMTFTPTADGMMLRFANGIEVIVPLQQQLPAMQTLITTIMRCPPTSNVVLNLDNYKQPLTIDAT